MTGDRVGNEQCGRFFRIRHFRCGIRFTRREFSLGFRDVVITRIEIFRLEERQTSERQMIKNKESIVCFTLFNIFFVNIFCCRGRAPPYFALSFASSFISGVGSLPWDRRRLSCHSLDTKQDLPMVSYFPSMKPWGMFTFERKSNDRRLRSDGDC